MKSPNKTSILAALAILSIVIMGGLYVYFFLSMKSKTEDAVSLSAQIGEISGSELRYRTAAAALQIESAQIDKLSLYFINEGDIVSFAKKIEALGPEAGVTLSIKALDPGAGVGGAPILSFQISAEGTFEGTQRLLSLLQNFPGRFEWKTVKLARTDNIALTAGASAVRASAPKWTVEASLNALNFTKQ